MITEDYVGFEVAKLLKEKGFDEPTTKSYYTEGFENPMIFSHDLLPCIRHDEFLCPTIQMAMKWLREVHNICIVIQPYDSYYKERYEFEINKKNNNDFTWEWISDIENTIFDTYEEAVEAAIKYCLTNLI